MCKKIALSMRIVEAAGYSEFRDAISHDWIRYLEGNGWYPVLLPNNLDDPVAYMEAFDVAALIISNGGSVNPSIYGDSSVGNESTYDIRYKTEAAVLEWAMQKKIRILAVCYGFQMVNVFLGGKLIRNIQDQQSSCIQHVACDHTLRFSEDIPADCLNAVEKVNSFHNEGVDRATLADGLVPFAYAEDGIVEGYFSPNHDVLGIQWHPERSGPSGFCQSELAANFLESGGWWTGEVT